MFNRAFHLLVAILLVLSFQPMFDSISAGGDETETPVFSAPLEGGDHSGELYGGILYYDDVVLIVNDNSYISREIGDYFVQQRNISESHVINISAPDRETINPSQFDDIAGQIKENLSQRNLTDRINYMVTTKGVPLRVSDSNWRSFALDQGLMLLDSQYENTIHNTGWIENPYFQDVDPEEMIPFSRDEYGIRLVTRLTGYTAEEAKRLVDLAGESYGVRGNALLDMDPRKGIGSGGYGVGNLWMSNAHAWLEDNNWSSHLDNNNEFVTDWDNTSAYFSWGSNDGDWGRSQMTNGGFEAGSGEIPSGWDLYTSDGVAERNDTVKYSGSWSLKLEGDGSGDVRAYQNVSLNYLDHRWIADARVYLEGVEGPGARIYLKGYDSTGKRTFLHTLYNRTGTRDWQAVQDPMENYTGTSTIMIVLELNGPGTAYFDNINLRVIRPHNTWVPGGIAETCVSTGGRSQTYGTWYGQSLIADLIRDGVTGVKGYAFEPFLSAISHADILFPAYYSGYSLAEAYWMGSQLGSWMGYVVGDPKCTPYVNQRGDMGFSHPKPLTSGVDQEGIPYLNLELYNKGNSIVENGLVEFYMDGFRFHSTKVSMDPGKGVEINLSSEDHPIQGVHDFRIVLNSDGEVWDFDQSNNELFVTLRVNTVPRIAVELPSTEINRTELLTFDASVDDPDGDFDLDGLNVTLSGPYGSRLYPDPLYNVEGSGLVSIDLSLEIPWNATLGFYDIQCSYRDPQGSLDSFESTRYLNIRNCRPTLEVNLSNDPEVPRNGEISMDLRWQDPDTPDGSLLMDYTVKPVAGVRLEVGDINYTSENSGLLNFSLPPKQPSQTWEISASVEDRDGAKASWRGTVRTYNQDPETVVLSGLGQRINRTGKASFTLFYWDPEGMDPREFNVNLFGPMGELFSGIVADYDPEISSGESVEFTVPGVNLGVGNYSLIITYEDDEGAGERLELKDALEVYNLDPEISITSILYSGEEGDIGEDLIRGNNLNVFFSVADPDSPSYDFLTDAYLLDEEGSILDELPLKRSGSGRYSCRISTDSEMDIGYYGLLLEVEDESGGWDRITAEDLFRLVTYPPTVVEGEVTETASGNVSVTIRFLPGQGEGLPGEVWILLFDGSDNQLLNLPLGSGGSELVWEGSGRVQGIVNRTSVGFVDGMGVVGYYNETLEMVIEEAPIQEVETPSDSDGSDSSLLWVIIAVIAALLITAVLALLLVLVVKSRKGGMQPPPPALGPDGIRGLAPSAPDKALPSGDGQTEAGELRLLQPARELEDGSMYHKPAPRTEDRRSKTDQITVDQTSTHETGSLENMGENIPRDPEPPDPAATETADVTPMTEPEHIEVEPPVSDETASLGVENSKLETEPAPFHEKV